MAPAVKKGAGSVAERGTGSTAELLRAVLAVHRHLDMGPVCQALLDVIGPWVGATDGFILVPDDDPQRLTIQATSMASADLRYRSLVRLDAAAVRRQVGQSAANYDGLGPLADLVAWPGEPPRASAVVPLRDAADSWIGIALLLGDEKLCSDGLQRAARLTEMSRSALEHCRTVAAMRDLVIKDDTARCYNRRYFEEFLPGELSRASRFRSPLSLIFLDMDNLKSVNNAHGHAAGSEALTEVAERIRGRIRKFDKLFRFGGDEFCILLPETEWRGALEVAERVRDAVASRPFLLQAASKHAVPEGVAMTASLGIATYPLHARTQQELIERADRAMQQIKRGTKNAIGVYRIDGGNDGTGSDG